MKRILTVIALCLTTAVFASTALAPDWFVKPPKDKPATVVYYYATGSSISAAQNAMAINGAGAIVPRPDLVFVNVSGSNVKFTPDTWIYTSTTADLSASNVVYSPGHSADYDFTEDIATGVVTWKADYDHGVKVVGGSLKLPANALHLYTP